MTQFASACIETMKPSTIERLHALQHNSNSPVKVSSLRLDYLSIMLSDLINGHSQKFSDLCRSHEVSQLYAFGSAVHGPFTSKSDVDLLVELRSDDPIVSGELLWSFWDDMEAFFDRKVDLLTPASLQNPVKKKHIDATKKLIYDGAAGGLVY